MVDAKGLVAILHREALAHDLKMEILAAAGVHPWLPDTRNGPAINPLCIVTDYRPPFKLSELVPDLDRPGELRFPEAR